MINFQKIEKKWQAAWEKEKAFEAKISNKPKFFVTFPIPYVNGAPHVGHSFSSFRVDSYARFKRAQGFNVLFPQGFHATGEPILGAVERLQSGDAAQIFSFKQFGASENEIEKFKQDPKYVAEFWMNRWIVDMKKSGFSIDWQRQFITAIDPRFNRFIEWQYLNLKKNDYVTKGTHPVIWCPHCQSPTGDHDRLEGEGESPIEYTLLKFEIKDEMFAEHKTPVFLVAATLRPETIYGVVNIWLNPDVEYALALVGKEIWVLSNSAAYKLADQGKDIRVIGHISSQQLFGKRVTDPLSNRQIPILPAHFVDPENTTGVVMSVPSHAPYDWIAVKELIDRQDKLERFGVTSQELEPISIISVEGFGDHPAIEVSKRLGITSQGQRDLLDQATSIVYKKEFHTGILKKNCGEYASKKVSEVKDHLVSDFKENSIADTLWESTDRVVCRCTNVCHVKILQDQWFLKYSDESWKAKAKTCLEKMAIYPDPARVNFQNTLDWLKDKACARKTGLGTVLPWDDRWIVETLSDSTIYMAYYTIAHIINSNEIKPEQLTDEVFDYIFLGKGKSEEIAKNSKISHKLLEEMTAQFNYWYPLDMRNSGKDLIQNHLTFFILHHVALFSQDKWPRGISVNGFVNVEGEKMSKSKGNFLVLSDLIDQYGSDLVRINIVGAAEGIEDADWRTENLATYRARITLIYDLAKSVKRASKRKQTLIDKWLFSVLQSIVQQATENYEHLKFRGAIQSALFDATNALKWYVRRTKPERNTLETALETITKLLSPVIPHIAEEVWDLLGKKPFIFNSGWPKKDERDIDEESVKSEQLVKQILEDVQNIEKIVKKKGGKPESVSLFVAKANRFKDAKEKKSQLDLLIDAKKFFQKELGLKVKTIDSDKSKHEKAEKALPNKVGILLE